MRKYRAEHTEEIKAREVLIPEMIKKERLEKNILNLKFYSHSFSVKTTTKQIDIASASNKRGLVGTKLPYKP